MRQLSQDDWDTFEDNITVNSDGDVSYESILYGRLGYDRALVEQIAAIAGEHAYDADGEDMGELIDWDSVKKEYDMRRQGYEWHGGVWRSKEEMSDIRAEAQVDASYERQERQERGY
jgi:hypothetical protein